MISAIADTFRRYDELLPNPKIRKAIAVLELASSVRVAAEVFGREVLAAGLKRFVAIYEAEVARS